MLMPVPVGDTGRPGAQELCHSDSHGDLRGDSWLWPGALGSASTLSPSLAVLPVWV